MSSLEKLEQLVIAHADTQWHQAFIDYVPRVFPRVSFARWHALGGWNEDYRAFALAHASTIVANISVHRMNVILCGRAMTAWQLGAVGVVPEWRGKGLQRPLMQRVLESVPAQDMMFLFANDTVLDFYPRFGFRPVTETLFGADYRVEPCADRLRRLSLDNAEDRALLARVAAHAAPVTSEFGARDYTGILLWYYANFYSNHFHYCETSDAVIVAEAEGDTLRICDVLARRRLDLREYLPRVAESTAQRIEFGFTPGDWWPDATPIGDCRDSPLFVRGNHALPSSPFKFPMLAQT